MLYNEIMRIEQPVKYTITKLPGCKYKMAFMARRKKELFSITATPRFWLLFSKQIRDTIRETRFKAVRTRKRS